MTGLNVKLYNEEQNEIALCMTHEIDSSAATVAVE